MKVLLIVFYPKAYSKFEIKTNQNHVQNLGNIVVVLKMLNF